MSDAIYHRLAKVLDTLPNGYPETSNGIEIKILKKIFTPEQAELFCDLRLTFETPEQIAKRTHRPLEGLNEKLHQMMLDGQIFGLDFGETKIYKMVPFVFGIYEFQINRLDRELAELCEEYGKTFFKQFFETKPQLMHVIPIETQIQSIHRTLPYEQVSTIIENGQSFAVNDCICKKEKHLIGKGCSKPVQVCLGIAPIAGYFETSSTWGGRVLTQKEAYELLRQAEEAGLVHMTNNMESGHFFICNCCGCCCGILRSINELGVKDAVNSHFYAEIDADACESCGICATDRCQVHAIEETESAYQIIKEKCIGCGLCVTTCPADAIQLKRKEDSQCVVPPKDETDWFKKRGEYRGVDFSQFE